MTDKRIGSIAIHASGYNIKGNTIAELVRYYPNEYFGREADYNWSEGGLYTISLKSNGAAVRIHRDCFLNKEHHYVVAFLDRLDDGTISGRAVGSRFADLPMQARCEASALIGWLLKQIDSRQKP